MAEAIITRTGGESGEANVVLNNSTYQQIGLDNGASLDDVILSLAYKSNDYATIICTVLDPDGSPAVGATVNFVDGNNIALNYTTDNEGKCIFKTNSGTCDINENHGYFDIKPHTAIKVDAPVGFTKFVTFQRKVYENGSNLNVYSNMNIKFSRFINNANVICIGGGGAGGYTWGPDVNMRYSDGSGTFTPSAACYGGGCGYAGSVRSSQMNFVENKNYYCYIGAGGDSYKLMDTSNSTDTSESRCYTWIRCCVNNEGGGYGESGGSTSFGGVLSASGGSGGPCATNWSNTGQPSNYSGRYTGYGYGDGGPSSWGMKTSIQQSRSKSSSSYHISVNSYFGSSCSGSSGGIMLRNIQYKEGYNLVT